MAQGGTPDQTPPGSLPIDGCALTTQQLDEQAAIMAEQESWGLHDLLLGDLDAEYGLDAEYALADEDEDGLSCPRSGLLPDHVALYEVHPPFPPPGLPAGPGFAGGGALDTLPPGPALLAAVDDACEAGLGGVTDDALAGVILAARRCESRAAARLLAAVDELGRRRLADADHRVAGFLDTELALLLTLTRRAAGTLLGFAGGLAQLPATAAALAQGQIHRAQADILAYETALLDPDRAAAVEQLILPDAPPLSTTRLQRLARRAVLAADPGAARRRAEQAKREARVELRDERSGATAALAGRDLPTAAALAANQRINHAACELKAAGVPATLAQLRAMVFLGLLTGTDPMTFLLPPEDPAQDTPATPPASDSQPPSGQPAGTGVPPGLGVRGTVNLTLPLGTWIGATLAPGDITGLGPATAETSQQLADWIAASPGSRWCLTLTDQKGRAVGHGCARRPPPPPADTQRLAAWLARLKVGPIQAGECTHARAVPGYRIPGSLDHIVKIRQQTCSNPICARPATHSDNDHTRAHDKGGITCECGLGPACRHCHQAKQAHGWRLEQPRPGEFVWRPPHGRSYPAAPDTYPI